MTATNSAAKEKNQLETQMQKLKELQPLPQPEVQQEHQSPQLQNSSQKTGTPKEQSDSKQQDLKQNKSEGKPTTVPDQIDKSISDDEQEVDRVI